MSAYGLFSSNGPAFGQVLRRHQQVTWGIAAHSDPLPNSEHNAQSYLKYGKAKAQEGLSCVHAWSQDANLQLSNTRTLCIPGNQIAFILWFIWCLHVSYVPGRVHILEMIHETSVSASIIHTNSSCPLTFAPA